jgi:3-methylcrotonyl-CoA carboxylase alpha subunit
MFRKILIANRGENAVRIARTCERMGIATVAVYNEADRNGRHVQVCNEAHCIGPIKDRLSYLNVEAIVEVAKKSGAEAIHPGIDLLAETPAFVRAVEDTGLVFIGPSGAAMEAFTDKLQARAVAVRSGIRIIKGAETPIEDLQQARDQAESIGYPLVLKAADRGAGIALQVVSNAEQLENAIDSVPAETSRGRTRMYLEAFIKKPRHIEVQIAADKKGNSIALGERECSIQREHRKLIDESPAPALTGMTMGDQKRQMIWELAILLAKEVDYRGVGTAEFMVDADNRFYFLGFTPRLQVEHSVTELCTDLDLVELQIRIAADEKLPVKALRAEPAGHAIEARICMEDSSQDRRRSKSRITDLRWPTVAPGKLRIETGYTPHTELSTFDSQLLAKVVTFGPSRNRAVLALDRILAETVIAPLRTNIDFLRAILQSQSFQAGQFDTSFCDSL